MTDNEIIQALRHCGEDEPCETCPVQLDEDERVCVGVLFKHAATAIERLTAENAALREKVPQWISVEDRLPEIWKNEDGVLVNYMIYSPEFGGDIGNYHAKAERWLCI